MTGRVWSSNVIRLQPGEEFISDSVFPWHGDRPAWLKHMRVYEFCPELATLEANTVLADAFHVGNQDSIDGVIRDIGIVGCWRPSTILIGRLTNYVSQRLLVSEPTVAHALWNVDLHDPLDRHSVFGFELVDDHDALLGKSHERVLRVVFELVEMTDVEANESLETRLARLESLAKILGAFARATNEPVLRAILKRADELGIQLGFELE